MKRIENDCVFCDRCYHCGRDSALHIYCDECKEEIDSFDTFYSIDSLDLCERCFTVLYCDDENNNED